MLPDHDQILWDDAIEQDLRQLLRMGLEEDLEGRCDLTTDSLVPEHAMGMAHVVVREDGVVAGLATGPLLIEVMGSAASWEAEVADGSRVVAGQRIASWSGPARDLLTGERTLLNVLCHLSGIATAVGEYVAAVEGTSAGVYDTRKTLPGWRRLQKYAVASGGGRNHRRGLDDAVLIKDNHLCFGSQADGTTGYDVAEAVERAREFSGCANDGNSAPIVQVEVDSLSQFERVLTAQPDIVLLDNMSLDELRTAVAIRNQRASDVALEASGGINLSTIRDAAETGVDRISVGAITHSVVALDIALDWDRGIAAA